MHHSEVQPHARIQPSVWAGRLACGRLVLTLSVNRASVSDRPGERIVNRLETLRRERGLAREELAARLQIHPSTLVAMERGGYLPSLGLALRLGEIFELPVEAIFCTQL